MAEAQSTMTGRFLHTCTICSKSRWKNVWERYCDPSEHQLKTITEYVRSDDVVSVQECLRSGCAACDSHGSRFSMNPPAPCTPDSTAGNTTLLHIAAFAGSSNVLSFLLQQRANPEGSVRIMDGKTILTPLLAACNLNHEKSPGKRAACISLLLQARANPNAPDEGGCDVKDYLRAQHAGLFRKMLTEAGVDFSVEAQRSEQSELDLDERPYADGDMDAEAKKTQEDTNAQYPKCYKCSKKRNTKETPWRSQWGKYFCSDRCKYPRCSGKRCSKARPQVTKYSFDRRPEWFCSECR